MLIGKDPLTGYTWVFFGTGKFLSTDDTADKQKQSWYGLIVDGNGGLVSALSSGRSSLLQRKITTEVDSTTGLDKRAVDVGVDGDMTGKSGWYMDLVYNGIAEGERMLLPNQFNGNMLIGTTMIPDNSNICRTGGRGWIYAINPFLGTNPKATYFDVNGDGIADSNDMIGSTPVAGIGFDTAPNQPTWVGGLMLVGMADGSSTEIETFGGGGAASRVSWHEIVNQ
jgi:type IV pilus assembly protein PilY1